MFEHVESSPMTQATSFFWSSQTELFYFLYRIGLSPNTASFIRILIGSVIVAKNGRKFPNKLIIPKIFKSAFHFSKQKLFETHLSVINVKTYKAETIV